MTPAILHESFHGIMANAKETRKAMEKESKSPGPIFTAHLFPEIERRLLELLRSIRPDEWEVQTVSPKWKVKDVAAHLLDTQLRKLSMVRDGYVAQIPSVSSQAELVEFIAKFNEEGVRIYRRLSPAVLVSLMETASRQNAEFHQSLDPFAPAAFAVSWAGEEKSQNWFDTAREYTERWHHQQQIRLALDRPGILTPELYFPVLDCFMRALPFTYRNVAADAGAVLRFDISGDCGGTWYLQREGERWRLANQRGREIASRAIIPQEIAWRIFTKGIDQESAAASVKIEGDRQLASHVLTMRSIVG